MIARTAAQVGAPALRDSEAVLLKAAQELDPARFGMVTRRLPYCLDPDGTLAEANEAFDRRFLHLGPGLDGMFILDGLLDAEGGAALRTALNALERPVPNERRTAAQRQADALVELVHRQLAGGDLPEVGGQRPHLTVTTTVETLAEIPGHPAGHLEWGFPIPSETVKRLACDASVTTVTLSHDGQWHFSAGFTIAGCTRRAGGHRLSSSICPLSRLRRH